MEGVQTEPALSVPVPETDIESALEAPQAKETEMATNKAPQAKETEMASNNEAADPRIEFEWALNICLAFAAQPIQTTSSSSKAYAEAGLALVMCAFASSFLSKSRCFDRKTSGVLQWLGVFLGVTAFFVRVTTQSSLWLKCAGGAVYSLIWIAILLLPLINKPLPIAPVKQWMSQISARVLG